jgi:hypothetical protein
MSVLQSFETGASVFGNTQVGFDLHGGLREEGMAA